MSHTSVVRSVVGKVGNCDADILKLAFEALADELEGAELSQSVSDTYDRRYTSQDGIDIIIAIKTKNLSHGIGVGINKDGNLVFIGDESADRQEYNRLKKLIEEKYEEIAYIVVGRKMGGKVDLKNSEEGTAIEITLDD